jgi:hypothetical protein
MPHERIGGLPFNEPTARFGNIALIPAAPLRSSGGRPDQESILVETRSIPGYSGSPVFWYQRYTVTPETRVLDPNKEMKFLGIDYAHLSQHSQVLLEGTLEPHPMRLLVETTSGMMAIIPAWRLDSFLADERVQAPSLARRRELAKFQRGNVTLE